MKTKTKKSSRKHRNVSGLHRRLLDGSSRQLAVLNATSPDENQMNVSAASGDLLIGSANISNSTSSLTSNPSSSISIACSNANSQSNAATTTLLASTSPYPMVAPSSCLVMRRPSANMFVSISCFFRLHFQLNNR